MNSISARELVLNYKNSLPNPNLTNKEIIEGVSKSINITLTNTNPDAEPAVPRLTTIRSNLKGEYFVILCDTCNKKCRKVHGRIIMVSGMAMTKLLCGKCAGVRYKRRTEVEKRALSYLLNPQSFGFRSGNQLSLKQSLAVLEAGFMEERLRQRAYSSVDRYLSAI